MPHPQYSLTQWHTDGDTILAQLHALPTDTLYDNILLCQVERWLTEDICFFHNCLPWNNARTVVDIGCGPGHWLHHVARYFPDKQYAGIDRNESFIASATARYQSPQIHFSVDDACTFNLPRADVYTARALLQHLPDCEIFFAHLQQQMPAGALLYIFDADPAEDAGISFPDVPLQREFYASLAALQAKTGSNRLAIEWVRTNAARYSFRMVTDEKTYAPIVGITDGIASAFVYDELARVELSDRFYSHAIDQKKLLTQLLTWATHPAAYTQHYARRLLLIRL